MAKENNHLETLAEIKSLMERSSRFLSLSGLSGVFAGLFAIAGALIAYAYFGIGVGSSAFFDGAKDAAGNPNTEFYIFFLADASIVLIASLSVGYLFTSKKARKQGDQVWTNATKRMLSNLMLPLFAGGVFCLILMHHGFVGLLAPTTLIFYGLALLNASKYTLDDVRYLGIMEILLGLIAAFFMDYGLLFWLIGFGLFHIIYGLLMYKKYEK